MSNHQDQHIQIRDAELKDYGFLCEAFRKCNIELYKLDWDLYQHPNVIVPRFKFYTSVLVRSVYEPAALKIAEIEGHPVGAAFIEPVKASSWSRFDREAVLDNVYVLPEYRREGVGKTLSLAAIDWAKAKGFEYVRAKVSSRNKASAALMKSCGLEERSVNFGGHLDRN